MILSVAHHPIYKHPLPEGHRFPMIKYELLPQQLVREGIVERHDFFTPSGKAGKEDICRAHTEGYFNKLSDLQLTKSEARKLGFPLSKTLVERGQTIIQGTIEGCLKAKKHGAAMNIAGGTHHAYSDHGEAFCLLNDQAVAARYLLHHNLANKILIIDLDVHQGNGTAEIFSGDERVFTFSMHGAKNYPFKKEKSDLDVGMPDGCGDHKYLKKLKEVLPSLIQREKPDFIFYLCGVDVLETDKLGRLSLTPTGCQERDRITMETIRNYSTSDGSFIPVQCSMGGGYSEDIAVIIDAHTVTFSLARDILLI